MSSPKYAAAVREGLPEGLAAFICLDSLAVGGVFSGHVHFHSRCFMVVRISSTAGILLADL